MIRTILPIDRLIAIVQEGGSVKTGVDVYDRDGTLLLAGDILVDQVQTLSRIRRGGVRRIPLAEGGGLFDGSGNEIPPPDRDAVPLPAPAPEDLKTSASVDVAQRLKEIQEIRQTAVEKLNAARTCLKRALDQIRETDGQFDVEAVRTLVSDMVAFSAEAGQPFAYTGRELFSFDDYLYGHAVHVCAMGTAVARKFNSEFSAAVQTALWPKASAGRTGSFSYFLPEDLDDISLGLFVYDIGKALVPEDLLNKPSALTREERLMVQRHSYEFGSRILEANGLVHPVLSNMVRYHHAPIFEGEKGGYPKNRPVTEIPLYVKICKLTDIYDAMISRTSYGDARNQTAAATELVRAYVRKDPLLQFILHAFVGSIGLYPPGSIVFLKNGQMAYVLEDKGPIVIPFTDTRGEPLPRKPDPFDVRTRNALFQVDAERSVKTPKEVFDRLPDYIRTIAVPSP